MGKVYRERVHQHNRILCSHLEDNCKDHVKYGVMLTMLNERVITE